MDEAALILSIAKVVVGGAVSIITALGGLEARRSKMHKDAEEKRLAAAALRDKESVDAMRALTGVLSDVRVAMGRNEQKVDSHEQSDDQRFANIDHRFDQLEAKVDGIADRMTREEGKA